MSARAKVSTPFSRGRYARAGPADLSEDDVRRCWSLHKRFLALVKPREILALGNGKSRSAYSFLVERSRFEPWKAEGTFKDGKFGRISFEIARERFESALISIPHPSRFGVGPMFKNNLLAFRNWMKTVHDH